MTDVADLAAGSNERPAEPGATERSSQPVRDDEDLARLLQQSARGDAEAFTTVYDTTAARAYGLGLNVLHDPARAGDVVLETYVQLWTHSARFDPARGSAISWIMTMVHHTAVSRWRSDTAVPAGDVPSEDASARCGLGGLPSTQRLVLQLSYLDGYTHSEAERVSGLPVGTAQVCIREGLTTLRDGMEAR